MTKIEKYLPYIISFVISGIYIFTNNIFDFNSERFLFPGIWLMLMVFLSILWKVLEVLLNISNKSYKWMAILMAISSLSIIYSRTAHSFLGNYTKVHEDNLQSLFALRFFLAAILIITIIQSLRSAKDREHFRNKNILLQAENLEAQLDQLRQQVNPHFLFNCLSTLLSMVRLNDPQSEEYILKLSDVYRQILQKRKSTVVTVNEELEFLQAYTYLLKLRHEQALTVDIKIDNESLQYSLPVFSLQLLVENSIKHNIVSKAHPLNIQIYQNDPATITVSNNYQPKKQLEESFGVGTKNLKIRYGLLGMKDGIIIEQSTKVYSTTLKLF